MGAFRTDVRAAIRAGKNATQGWPGKSLAVVSEQLGDAEEAYLGLLHAAKLMARVRIAKGNDSGRLKQKLLREAIYRVTGDL